MVTVMVTELVSVIQSRKKKKTKGKIKIIDTHLSAMLIIRLMFQGSFTLQN